MEKRFVGFFSLLLSLASASVPNGGVGVELWCVAKNNAEDAALKTALDWACGAGGADCSPIQQSGPCYDPNDVQVTASFAFNDYYLKHGLTDDSCSFDNTAALTSLNPSHDKCKFPSSLSVSNGNGNGNFSGSIQDGGVGPSIISGCTRISWLWFWPLITGHVFVVLSRIISER